jgi:NhaA family Na+:H+ antiporter
MSDRNHEGTPYPAAPIDRLLRPFHDFASTESSGGIVLLAATVVALLWANSGWAGSYARLWETALTLAVGGWSFEMSLHHLVNDGLMVVFFFLVGLEIKREMLVGELSSLRASALPIAAAGGGMLFPALIYFALNRTGPGAAGWGIPMATDIAFALGVLALMGPRIPVGLKVFLAALAIADDLGAVLVIALFYTRSLDLLALALGFLVLLALAGMNALGVRRPGLYALGGVALWAAFLASGVHATIAGVLLALTVPVRTRIDTRQFLDEGRAILDDFDAAGEEAADVLTSERQQGDIHALEEACEAAQSPLIRIEHALQPWVAFLVVPLFALANAGVRLRGVDLAGAASHSVTLGVVLGLVLGKPIGITLLSWLSVRSGAAQLPSGVRWRQIHAVSWLGGIGFTMSLFVAGLAFGEGSELLEAAKLGILAASTLAALLGWVLLRAAGRRREAVNG